MYERPPSAEPDRSWAMRYLAVFPLALATCSACPALLSLLYLFERLDRGDAWRELPPKTAISAIIAMLTIVLSISAWRGRRRRWNQHYLVGLSALAMIGFGTLVYAASRL